jgi:phosphate acyltransferase
MGGDFAPKATIAGALLALQELDAAHTVQLVGQTAVIQSQLASLLAGELSQASAVRNRITIVEAPDIIARSRRLRCEKNLTARWSSA